MAVTTTTWLPSRRDVAIAVAVGVVLVANLALGLVVEDSEFAVRTSTYVLTVLAAAVLAWRNVAPIPVVVFGAVITAVYLGTENAPSPIVAVLLVALYTLATRRDRRTVAFVVAALVVTVIGVGLVAEQREPTILERISIVSFVVFPIVLGDAVRSRRRAEEEAAERIRATEAAADARTERRLQAERLQIARDLHDVIAHSMASISVQAGAASLVIDADQELAKAAIEEIKRASRTAMTEIRSTLNVLRADGDAAPVAVTGDIEELHRLVDGHPDAMLHTDGRLDDLDPVLSVALYRIVQESLTNSVKHAPGAAVDVVITRTGSAVSLRVANEAGPGEAQPNVIGAGFGIIGMRERADSIGGELRAERRLDGGFTVEATIPVQHPTGGNE